MTGESSAKSKYLDDVTTAFQRIDAFLPTLNGWYTDTVNRRLDSSPQITFATYSARWDKTMAEYQQQLDAAELAYRRAVPDAALPALPFGLASLPGKRPVPSVGPTAYQDTAKMTRTMQSVKAHPVLQTCGWVATGLLACLIVMFIIGQASSPHHSSTAIATSNMASTSTVLYEVEGTAKGTTINVEAPTGSVQLARKAVPLANKNTGVRGLSYQMSSGDGASILAQNTGDTGTIICRITIDGIVVSENTSSGAYTIASCHARVP